MQIIRFILPSFALLGVFALYWVLHLTIIVSGNKKLTSINAGNINFVRMLNESKVETKQRIKKQIPKLKQIKIPPKISSQMQNNQAVVATPKLDINIQMVNLPVNIQMADYLSAAPLPVKKPQFSSEAIPILRVPPIYPRRAKMLRKQGYVKLKLFISEVGTVQKAEILEAKPQKLFDKAALNSVYAWKFKPRLVEGKAIKQIATQVVEFKLN